MCSGHALIPSDGLPTPGDPPTLHDLSGCSALIVDPNQSYRTVLRGMLANLGMKDITLVGRLEEARHALNHHTYDLVLCDYHFDDSPMKGPELLDEIRRSGRARFSTVFAIVTSEASPEKVAEAAESALDCYIIRPLTINSLAKRVHQARLRKWAMAAIHAEVEAQHYEVAAQMCMARFHQRAPHWVDAARLGGELMLRLEQPLAAQELFEAVNQAHAVPWAKLGIARAQIEAGQGRQARNTLDSLMDEHPGYADAYDVLGRAQMAAGEFEAALATFQRAIALTPNSLGRLQKAGMLAFYLGKSQDAQACLAHAARLGAGASGFDHQCLVVQSFLAFDTHDVGSLQRMEQQLSGQRQPAGEERRSARLSEVIHVLKAMLERQVAEVVNGARGMVRDSHEPDFDFEAAGNLLGVLARLRHQEMELPDAQDWVSQTAARFCISRASTDLLCLNVQCFPDYEVPIRHAYKGICQCAEDALTRARQGEEAQAVQALIDEGRKVHNAKLIDLADMVLARYRDRIPEEQALTEAIRVLRQNHCPPARQATTAAAAAARQSVVMEGTALALPAPLPN